MKKTISLQVVSSISCPTPKGDEQIHISDPASLSCLPIVLEGSLREEQERLISLETERERI